MNMTIGNTSVPVLSCTRMRDPKRGFYLDIKIPKENIGMQALYDMFDNCAEKIVVVDDDGGVCEYTGFKTLANFSCEYGVYTVIQVCTSEYEAQLSLTQSKIAEIDVNINDLAVENEELRITQETNDAEMLYQICLLQLGCTDEDL